MVDPPPLVEILENLGRHPVDLEHISRWHQLWLDQQMTQLKYNQELLSRQTLPVEVQQKSSPRVPKKIKVESELYAIRQVVKQKGTCLHSRCKAVSKKVCVPGSNYCVKHKCRVNHCHNKIQKNNYCKRHKYGAIVFQPTERRQHNPLNLDIENQTDDPKEEEPLIKSNQVDMSEAYIKISPVSAQTAR